MGPALRQKQIVAAKARLSYLEREAVQEDGKAPIVLLHGLVASAETMADLLAELPTDRRLVALNLLAFQPENDASELDLSFAGLATLVAAFVEAAGMERPILLGHSHGGALSLRVAVSYPDLLSGMVLLCPAHPFGGYDPRVVRFYRSASGGVFARLLRWMPRWAQRIGLSRMMGPGRRPRKEQVEAYRRVFRSPRVIPRVLRLLRTWEIDMQALKEALQRAPVETPALLLWGDHDVVVPVGTAAALEEHMVRWEQATLPGAGHLLADEAPAECGSLIRTWLIWLDTL